MDLPSVPSTTVTIPNTEQINNDFLSMSNMGKLVAGVFTTLTSSISSLGTTIDGLVSKFSGLSNSQQNFISNANAQSAVATTLSTKLIGVGNAFDSFGQKTKSFQSLSSQFEQVAKSAQFTDSMMTQLAGALNLEGAYTKTRDALVPLITNALASADAFYNLKNSYLETQSSSGGLGEAFAKSGKDLSGLNDIIGQHKDLLQSFADQTGNNLTLVTTNWNTLAAAIPGATNAQIKGSDDSNFSINATVATMRLASGTGQEYSKVVQDMAKSLFAYNLTTEESLQFTAKAYEVTQALGLKTSTTNEFIDKNIKAFQGLSIHGNNAINVLYSMQSAFQSTGLSADQSADMIGKMTSGLAGMDLGKKALLSAQSGGPGGLRGGLQIEQQLQTDVEGVFNKAKEALKKQFGKIYSLDEATKSDEGASQFTRQRELLKSGAFGIKANSDNEATHILEAFKNGTNPEKLQDSKSSLNEAMNRGETLQTEGNGFLRSIDGHLESMQFSNGYSNANIVDKLQGSTKRSDRPEWAEKNAQMMRENRLDSQIKSDTISANIKSSKNLTPKFNENAATNDSFQFIDKIKKNIMSSEDTVRHDSLQNSLQSNNPAIVARAQTELESVYANMHEATNNKVKSGASQSDITSARDREQYFGNLFNSVRDQATGRGAAVGNQANFAANNQQSADQQPGHRNRTNIQDQQNHNADHKFDVTIRGLCIDCARPVQPDAHMQARTDGAGGTR